MRLPGGGGVPPISLLTCNIAYIVIVIAMYSIYIYIYYAYIGIMY